MDEKAHHEKVQRMLEARNVSHWTLADPMVTALDAAVYSTAKHKCVKKAMELAGDILPKNETAFVRGLAVGAAFVLSSVTA